MCYYLMALNADLYSIACWIYENFVNIITVIATLVTTGVALYVLHLQKSSSNIGGLSFRRLQMCSAEPHELQVTLVNKTFRTLMVEELWVVCNKNPYLIFSRDLFALDKKIKIIAIEPSKAKVIYSQFSYLPEDFNLSEKGFPETMQNKYFILKIKDTEGYKYIPYSGIIDKENKIYPTKKLEKEQIDFYHKWIDMDVDGVKEKQINNDTVIYLVMGFTKESAFRYYITKDGSLQKGDGTFLFNFEKNGHIIIPNDALNTIKEVENYLEKEFNTEERKIRTVMYNLHNAYIAPYKITIKREILYEIDKEVKIPQEILNRADTKEIQEFFKERLNSKDVEAEVVVQRNGNLYEINAKTKELCYILIDGFVWIDDKISNKSTDEYIQVPQEILQGKDVEKNIQQYLEKYIDSTINIESIVPNGKYFPH